MDWTVTTAPSARVELARAFVDLAPSLGVRSETLAHASRQLFGDAEGWRTVFPGGVTEAVWFVSEVSDASMRSAFLRTPAAGMAEVVATRFDQNRHLKRFVRRIMQFDFANPRQGLARMQRTARVMYACLPPSRREARFLRLAALNLAYTGLVFIWLFDATTDDRATRASTSAAMRLLGL